MVTNIVVFFVYKSLVGFVMVVKFVRIVSSSAALVSVFVVVVMSSSSAALVSVFVVVVMPSSAALVSVFVVVVMPSFTALVPVFVVVVMSFPSAALVSVFVVVVMPSSAALAWMFLQAAGSVYEYVRASDVLQSVFLFYGATHFFVQCSHRDYHYFPVEVQCFHMFFCVFCFSASSYVFLCQKPCKYPIIYRTFWVGKNVMIKFAGCFNPDYSQKYDRGQRNGVQSQGNREKMAKILGRP